jgi:hypothetical protein
MEMDIYRVLDILHHMATILVCYGSHFEPKQKFVQPIPIFLAYLVPLDVDVVPNNFDQFLFGEKPAMIIFLFFYFLSFWPFPWQWRPF